MQPVTNEDFLRAIFGAEHEDAHVCAFACDPIDAGALWAGRRWRGAQNHASFPAQNSYFTISLFDDDPGTGRAARRKALFRSTHVIVVDDVGTKVRPADVLRRLAEPSYKLETSPGNYQWGYILNAPEMDAERVNALLDGMIAHRLCADGKDPGMKGVTRYVRLPQGRNTKAKYGPGGFVCVLRKWHPERRFGIEALAQPWGITLPAPGATPAAHTVCRVTLGEAKRDRLFAVLEELGMVHGTRTGDGGWHIACPWRDEHTGRDDTGAAYWPGGGFKCHHGHCVDQTRADLVQRSADMLDRGNKPNLAALVREDVRRHR